MQYVNNKRGSVLKVKLNSCYCFPVGISPVPCSVFRHIQGPLSLSLLSAPYLQHSSKRFLHYFFWLFPIVLAMDLSLICTSVPELQKWGTGSCVTISDFKSCFHHVCCLPVNNTVFCCRYICNLESNPPTPRFLVFKKIFHLPWIFIQFQATPKQ